MSSPPALEVWVGPGDSEQAGRGLLSELPAEYNSYMASSGKLFMCRIAATGVVALSEPITTEGAGTCGVLGLWAWKRSVRTGKSVCVVNGGVSESRSVEWLAGTTNYNNLLAKARSALFYPGSFLAGYISFNGLNDAKDPPGSGAIWTANTNAMFNSYKAVLGNAPIYLIAFPSTPVQPDTVCPTQAEVRAAILAAPFAAGVALAAEGPWVEPDGRVHLSTLGNLNTAIALDAVIP